MKTQLKLKRNKEEKKNIFILFCLL